MDTYKNTEMILKKYRDAVWSIEVANMQKNLNSENPMSELLEIGYEDSVKMEEHTKTIEKNKRMLSLIDVALEMIKTKQKNGEEYYKILYYTFISTEPLSSCSEIVDRLSEEGFYMSEKTYFKRKNTAIKLLAEILFGA